MNRMIKLFQQKADNALAKRSALKSSNIGHECMSIEVDYLKLEASIWQKAADLLRKEELNR